MKLGSAVGEMEVQARCFCDLQNSVVQAQLTYASASCGASRTDEAYIGQHARNMGFSLLLISPAVVLSASDQQLGVEADVSQLSPYIKNIAVVFMDARHFQLVVLHRET
eukprot:38212-Eustigmatos_ZCMA.PRE.1